MKVLSAQRFTRRAVAGFVALALSGTTALRAIEPCDGIWVEPFASANAISGGAARLVAGAGFPATERFALDARALAEWYPDSDDGFYQIKADALAKWYATGSRTRRGNRAGPYLALGVGLGWARLSGSDTVTILAGGPVAEAGARVGLGPIPVFVEPFIGYSLTVGPRLGGDGARFGSAYGVNAGLRIGYSLGRND